MAPPTRCSDCLLPSHSFVAGILSLKLFAFAAALYQLRPETIQNPLRTAASELSTHAASAITPDVKPVAGAGLKDIP